jgi:hypothetical protein
LYGGGTSLDGSPFVLFVWHFSELASENMGEYLNTQERSTLLKSAAILTGVMANFLRYVKIFA